MENLMEVGQNQIPLKCEICNKEFKSKGGLKYHFNITHNFEKRHQCNICQKDFNIPSQLMLHLKSVHANKKDFKWIHVENHFLKQKP